MPVLLTKDDLARLALNAALPNIDHKPVCKLFTPDAAATWLVTEMDEDERLFGLCDLGLGCPELGYVMLGELEQLRGPYGLPVERDRWFEPKAPISVYADAARAAGQIVDKLPD